jgi:pimeloyl-ACP methyl ester carboxylesterase
MSIAKKASALLVSVPAVLGMAAIPPAASAAAAASASQAVSSRHVVRVAMDKTARITASTAAERRVAGLPGKFTRQKLAWNRCKPRNAIWQDVKCALFTVPLDYAKPNGRTIKVAIDESLATHRKNRGVLFTNPGGPGGAGLSLVPWLTNGAKVPRALHASFDIVGMNPRGVGPSDKGLGKGATELMCDNGEISVVPPRLPHWASSELRTLASRAKATETACARTANGIRPYITSMNTARDMDLLRIVLRKSKINYFGISYGTFLGPVYGAMFPHKLNRMVLDGAMSPLTSWYQQFIPDNQTKVANFSAFAAWAVKTNRGIGATPADVRKNVDDLYAELVKTGGTIGGYTKAGLSKDVAEFTRYRPDWVRFATSLRDALAQWHGGQADASVAKDVTDATALVPGPSEMNPAADENGDSTGVYFAVTCDWPWPKPDAAGYRAYNDNIRHWQKTFPYGSAISSMGPTACTYLSHKPAEKLPVIRRAGYPKGLVVNTDGDTQTPLSTAKDMARILRFDLITVTDDGRHGSAFEGSTCVDRPVIRYLTTGKLPGNRTCATTSPPGGNTSLTAEATTVAAQDGPDGNTAEIAQQDTTARQ